MAAESLTVTLERIGPYRVVRKLGEGGMGAVLEAIQEPIGRRVAVKVLHPKYAQEAAITARFFNEARAVNIIDHPGIVQVSDYGQLPDGTAYLVMEFLKGETLNQRAKRGALGLPDIVRMARQIASALAAAHEKNVFHRDLKPDNIMIAPDSEAPGGERAKVLDFGIAKIVSEHESDKLNANPGLTQAGAVMGTPKYMSPEQCRGTGKVDFKTDVYALGVIMFEMLTGKIPFDAEGTGAMMAMHMFQPPPPIREIEPSVSPPVEMLIQSMLAKDPAARPTMTEIAAKIEQMGIKSTGVLQVVMASQISNPGISHPGLHGPGVSHPGLQSIPMEMSGPTNNSRPSLVGLGQTQDPTNIKQGERLKRLAIPASIALVLSVIGLAIALRQKDPPPPPQPAPQPAAVAAKRVTWQITSTPPGVEVVRISDGAVVGITPWKSEQPAAPGKIGVTLRRSGFIDRQVLLDREADCNETVQLDPMPPAPANSEPEKPGKKPGKNSRPSKKNTHDNPFAPVH